MVAAPRSANSNVPRFFSLPRPGRPTKRSPSNIAVGTSTVYRTKRRFVEEGLEEAQQIIDELQLAFPDRQLVAHLNGDGHGEWDPDRLAQLMTNLGSNALQHSPPDTVVHISSQCDEQYVRFRVHNEGSIDPSALPTLFEPFHRSKGQARTGNVGFGLHITKCIVAVHGGTIEVASTAENGTTFTVVLPRYVSVNEPVTADQLPRPNFFSDR